MKEGGRLSSPPQRSRGNATGAHPHPDALAHHADITIFFFLTLNFSPICGV